MKDFISFKFSPKKIIKNLFLFLFFLALLSPFFKININNWLIFLTLLLTGVPTIILYKDNIIQKKSEKKIKKRQEKILIITILVLFSILLTKNLGKQDFREDEFQVTAAATGYLYEKNFYKWDYMEKTSGKNTNCVEIDKFCNYTRAFPHTWLITQSYKTFGISEWSSRIVSVLFGIIFIILVYYISLFFTDNKGVSLAIMTIAGLMPCYIEMFRYTRMYALLAPLSLLAIYLSYKSFFEEQNKKTILKKKESVFKKITEINYKYFLLLIPLSLFSLLIHANFAIITLSTLFFIFFLGIDGKNKKYSYWSIIILIPSLILINFLPKKINYFLSFFEVRNYEYLYEFLNEPFSWSLSLFLIVSAPLIAFLKKTRNKKIYFLTTIISISLLFFIFVADRYYSFMYMSHILSLSIILMIFSLFNISKIYNKTIKILIFISIAFLIIFNFSESYQKLYTNNNHGQYSKIYPEIIEKIKEDEVIFMQYPRFYYLQNTNKELKIIDIEKNKEYKIERFLEDKKEYKGYWFVWETKKNYHISEDLKSYIQENFTKIHGDGLDDYGVEVFYLRD